MTKDRFFAIVLRVPGSEMPSNVASVLSASTDIGNAFREWLHLLPLPQGSKVTRSIEITEEFATRTW